MAEILKSNWLYVSFVALFLIIGFFNKENHGIFIGNVLLHVLLIATFICIFYFAYAVTIEKQIVVDQLSFIVDGLSGNAALLPQDMRDSFKTSFNNTSPINKEQDNAAEKHNSAILKATIIKIVCAYVIFGILIVYFIKKDKDYNNFKLNHLLINALAALIGVGITEFLFLRFIARYYKSGDPNFVKLKMIEKLETI